jgi:hypothetical protein
MGDKEAGWGIFFVGCPKGCIYERLCRQNGTLVARNVEGYDREYVYVNACLSPVSPCTPKKHILMPNEKRDSGVNLPDYFYLTSGPQMSW